MMCDDCYRTRPIPKGTLSGRLEISPTLFTKTSEIFSSSRNSLNQLCESLVFWCGTETPTGFRLDTILAPELNNGPQFVSVTAKEFGKCSKLARANKVSILCQVHSHPGSNACHSDGDDHLIIMPFESMISIVVPNFGRRFSNIQQCCVHQFQARNWVLCSPKSVQEKTIYI